MNEFGEDFHYFLKNYPYLSSKTHPISFSDSTIMYLFFQNEDSKRSFLTELEGITTAHSEAFERILGTVLGFPPKAVSYYIYLEQLEKQGESYYIEADKKSICVSFCGMRFKTSTDYLVDDVMWLWDTYPNVEDVILESSGVSPTKVAYLDLKCLQEFLHKKIAV